MALRRPESVLVLVYTAAADVLLLKRREPVFWQSITGSLESGELPMQAAHRELAEETGIGAVGEATVDVIDCHYSSEFEIRAQWRHKYQPGVRVNTEHVFRCRLMARVDIQLSAEEHSEYCWQPIEQAIETVWSHTNKDALRRFVLPEFQATDGSNTTL